MVFKSILNLLILLIILVIPLQAYEYTPVLEFEVNLSENGNLINGYRDVTLKIYKDTTLTEIQSLDPESSEDHPSMVYTELFEQAVFTDGNVRLFIGENPDQPIDPSWFDGNINHLSLMLDGEDEVITTMSVVPRAVFANQSSSSESTPTGNLFPSISLATDNLVIVNSTADGFTYITTANLLAMLNLDISTTDISDLQTNIDNLVTSGNFWDMAYSTANRILSGSSDNDLLAWDDSSSSWISKSTSTLGISTSDDLTTFSTDISNLQTTVNSLVTSANLWDNSLATANLITYYNASALENAVATADLITYYNASALQNAVATADLITYYNASALQNAVATADLITYYNASALENAVATADLITYYNASALQNAVATSKEIASFDDDQEFIAEGLIQPNYSSYISFGTNLSEASFTFNKPKTDWWNPELCSYFGIPDGLFSSPGAGDLWGETFDEDGRCASFQAPNIVTDNNTRKLIVIGSPLDTSNPDSWTASTSMGHEDSNASVDGHGYWSKRDTIAMYSESTFIDSLFMHDIKTREFIVDSKIINIDTDWIEINATNDFDINTDEDFKINSKVFDSSSGTFSFKAGNLDYFSQTESPQTPYSISFRHAAEDGENSTGAMEISLLNKAISNTDEFIGFTTETGEAIGSITGQQADVFGIAQSGIKLESSGADYAEYLPKRDPNESIQAGDVVGVYNGKISKSTINADRVMVVSTMPLVIGNKRANMDLDTNLAIAFVGQVPVHVSGTVNTGDYIIASGNEDGTAIAVHPDSITATQLTGLIGKAWDSSDSTKTTLINVAITPLDIPASLLQSIETRQDKLEADNKELRDMIEAIQQQLSTN